MKKINSRLMSILISILFIFTQIFTSSIFVNAKTYNSVNTEIDNIEINKTVSKTIAKVNEEITVNYNIQPKELKITPNTVDKEIVLVMDTSGSMSEDLQGKSRLDVAKAAAKRFITKFVADNNAKIGLIQYADSGHKISELVSNTSFSSLCKSVDKFYAQGGTNTGDGLRLAYYMLKQSSNSMSKKYIVLLTDGEPTFYSCEDLFKNYLTSNLELGYYTNNYNDYNKGLQYANIVAKMISNDKFNINSFMIGCTLSEYGTNTLKEISGKANGICSFAKTAEDIDNVYDKLADKIQNELKINSIKFQGTMPDGIDINQVPAGFTVLGQSITGELGSIIYRYSQNTNTYTAQPMNFQIKIKAKQFGVYSLSKNADGTSNSFITYKDIDNADKKLIFPICNIIIENVTASINLGKTVDKANITSNQSFDVSYTIQPDKIPVENVDSSYEKGSDIVLVIDNSGSMDEIMPNSKNKTKIQVVRDTATNFINKFNRNNNINISLVKFSRRADVIKLDGSSLIFGNLGNNTQYKYLINRINDPNVLNAEGGTNIGDGLRVAYGLLKKQGNTGRKKYVVLLTDGVPTVSTVKNNRNFAYTKGNSYNYTGYIYDDNLQKIDEFAGITNYEYKMDQTSNSVHYIVNPGDNDYKQMALNYANDVSDTIKCDTTTNIKPIMIAFSNDADPTKLAQITGCAGGEYKQALSETDMNSVYSSIVTQVQSDFTISGVQFEEVFPQGINLKNVLLPDGFIKSGQKVTGILSSISYKLDSTGKFYEPLPMSGFTIKNLSGVAGSNNAATQYVLGSDQTSFISYKDINGAITKNYFPDTTINIFPNAPADISATLFPGYGQTDVYTLTVKSNTNWPNTIKSFNVGGAEKKVDLWSDTDGLASLDSSKSRDLNQRALTGNTSLYVYAKDKDNNIVNETVPLISVSNVELKDIEQNNNIRPGDIIFAAEPNAIITSLNVNGQTVATNQNTGTGIYKCLGVNLKDSDNIIEVTLINKFNNTSKIVLHQTIDATPPVITAYYTYSNKKIDAKFSENVNRVWLECDLNNDGKISSDEKVTVSTDAINKLKDIQVPDNFRGKNIVVKARDLSGNIGLGVPVDNTQPKVQLTYTDNSNKIIDVTVDELVNLIWLECDLDNDGKISSDEKVVILNTIGNEVRNVQIPDKFLGRDITVKAIDLVGNIGTTLLDNTPPKLQAAYTNTTYKAIDVIVSEKISTMWIECDLNKDGTITNDEKVEIPNGKIINTELGVEVNGVILRENFYGRQLTIKAQDLVGNVGYAVLKDLVPPSIALIATPTNKNVIVTANITDASGIAVQKYAVGSQDVNYFTTEGIVFAGTIFEVIPNGTYTVYAKDNEGNESVKQITIDNIDIVAPSVPKIIISNEKWSNTSVEVISINGSDAISGIKKYQYKIENGEWIDYDPNNKPKVDKEGQTLIYARAISNVDLVGSESSKIAKIDKTNPEGNFKITNLEGKVINITKDRTDKNLILDFTASDKLSGVKRIKTPDGKWINADHVTYTIFESGRYVFEAEDNAGNVSNTDSIDVKNIDKSTLKTGLFVNNQFKYNSVVNIVKGFSANLAFKIENLQNQEVKIELSNNEFIKISDVQVYEISNLKVPIKIVKVDKNTFDIGSLSSNSGSYVLVFKAEGLKITSKEKPISDIIKINDFERKEKHSINVVKLPSLQ